MSDSLPPADEALAAFAETAPERIDCDLWTLLDWALWGAGLADTLRVPLASTMVAAVPAEVRAQAEMVMAAWLKHRDVESPSRTNAELRKELAEARSECAALAAKYETDLDARRIAEEHLRRDVSEIGDECSALAAKVEAVQDLTDRCDRESAHWRETAETHPGLSALERAEMRQAATEVRRVVGALRVILLGLGEETAHAPAQEAQERPGPREGDTGKGTAVQGPHGRTEADR